MKRRRPTSKIYHTAMYLHHVCGKHTFTSREIHDAMLAACDWYSRHPYVPANIGERYYLPNLTADQVSNTFKRGYFELVATEPYRTYRINPLYVNNLEMS